MPSYSRRNSSAYTYDDYPLRGRRPSIANDLTDDHYYTQHYPSAHQHHTRDRDHSRGRRGYHRRPLDEDEDDHIGRDRYPRSRSRGLRVLDALEAGEGVDQAVQVMKREPSPWRRGAPPPRHRRRRRSSSVSSDSSIEDHRRWGREGGKERERGRSHARAYSQDRNRSRHAHHRGRSRHHSEQPHRSRSVSKERWGKQAARAALLAAVVEALRVRNDQGPWIGQKGSRVATAALGSAAIDATLASKQPDVHAGRHAFASTVGGMVVNRLANGKR